MGRQKLAEHFLVGKTAISNILKDSKNLRRDFRVFQGKLKKASPCKVSCTQRNFVQMVR